MIITRGLTARYQAILSPFFFTTNITPHSTIYSTFLSIPNLYIEHTTNLKLNLHNIQPLNIEVTSSYFLFQQCAPQNPIDNLCITLSINLSLDI